jgi:tRNA (guanine-N7-)-methyltransferase
MAKIRWCLDPLLNPYSCVRPVDWDRIFGTGGRLIVEIGFGNGEVLVRGAEQFPQDRYVGIEEHWERILKTLAGITHRRLEHPGALRNVRILKLDGRVVFDRYFDTQSIDHVYCFFPCPWPKKSHVKHRLFRHDFLRTVNNRLKAGGQVHIVTDDYRYFLWIRDEAAGTGFECRRGLIAPQFGTKFERKWTAGGQDRFYEIRLIKTDHQDVPVTKDADVKSYFLREFAPDRFSFSDVTGPCAFIFKDKIFDAAQGRLMVHLIVNEPDMMQHIWIEIKKTDKGWRVYPLDGQNVISTLGMAAAVETVFHAARQTVNNA